MHMLLWVGIYKEYRTLKNTDKGVGFTGHGITVSCEPTDVCARNELGHLSRAGRILSLNQ